MMRVRRSTSLPRGPDAGAGDEGPLVRVEEELRHMIPRFFENRWKDVNLMDKALAENDFETVRALGHNMKGVAGSFNFAVIAEIAGRLEQAAKEKQAEKI